MRILPLALSVFFLVIFLVPLTAFAQTQTGDQLRFEVRQVHPYISVSPQKLQEAQTLADLNRHYKPEWVKKYYAVEVTAIHQGKTQKATNRSHVLSEAQKTLMLQADAGTEIAVQVQYLPENNLRNNQAREIDFTFTLQPQNGATYPGGTPALYQYLQETAIDLIPTARFAASTLAAVKFSVGVEGEISKISMYESAKDEQIDALLLESIRKMPCWKPAEYMDGTTTEQEFVLTVGNLESCVINLLSIRED